VTVFARALPNTRMEEKELNTGNEEKSAPWHNDLFTVGPIPFAVYAMVAAFGTYFCMYAFRKPFSAGNYADPFDPIFFDGVINVPRSVDMVILPALTVKSLFIISQVFGYCMSKFIGIKIVSELPPSKRSVYIIGLISIAHLALLGFAITPEPYSAFFLFLNGLPLGMIWGLTFGFLEGRRLTEVLGAALSASYIIASGFVKTVGRWVMNPEGPIGVSEEWMPFVTGLFFLPFLVLFVLLLSKMPPPSSEDVRERTRRVPMMLADRKRFMKSYFPGLLVLIILYMFLTAYRDFRDNFAVEIWTELGDKDASSILTATELPVGFCVMLVMAALVFVRDNRFAFLLFYWLMFLGVALIGISTMLFELGFIGPFVWFMLIGLGLYLAYVPVGCMLFDRMMAALGFVGTAGFMIYVADAFGYLGTVGILLFKDFGSPDLSWLSFFTYFSYIVSTVAIVGLGIVILYFARKSLRDPVEEAP
jgi:hypothetical protein